MYMRIYTHNRYFLEETCQWILELERGEGKPFEGNYGAWLQKKSQLMAQAKRQDEALARTLESELEWLKAEERASSSALGVSASELSAMRHELATCESERADLDREVAARESELEMCMMEHDAELSFLTTSWLCDESETRAEMDKLRRSLDDAAAGQSKCTESMATAQLDLEAKEAGLAASHEAMTNDLDGLRCKMETMAQAQSEQGEEDASTISELLALLRDKERAMETFVVEQVLKAVDTT